MKRFHVTIFAFVFAMIAWSIATAQHLPDQSHGIVHPISVKSKSVNGRDVTDVDIVVAIDMGREWHSRWTSSPHGALPHWSEI
jgi:hypothetical protein